MKTGTHERKYWVLEYLTTKNIPMRRHFPTLAEAIAADCYPRNKRRRYYEVNETRVINEVAP